MKRQTIKKSSDDASSLNLGRYINLLSNHIRFICIVTVIITSIAFIVSYILPKKYSASSTISVEENIVSDLVQGIAVTTSIESKIRLLEVQLMSRNLLEQVASLLELDLHANTAAQKEALILSLRQNINILHDRRRGVFYIRFMDSNAIVARDVVNTLIRVYIETNTSEKRQESFDATTFLSDQIEIFQNRIDDAQKAIDDFKVEQSLYLSLNEGFVQQKINSLNQQIENLRIEKNKLQSKKHMLSDASKLEEELHGKESDLRKAQAVYTDKHPILQRLRREVESLKIQIEEAQNTPENMSDNSEFKILDIELKSLEETEASLIKERDENYKNLEAMPSIKTQLSELEQAKANELIIYEQLVGRFGRSEVSKQMELQDKAVSFKVIDAAVTPTRFVTPMRYLIMVGGIVAGLGLAVTVVIGKSFLRPLIHSVEDLNIYSIPVLVKLPVITSPQLVAKKRRSNWIWVLTTSSFLGLICVVALLEFLGYTFVERMLPF